MLLNDKRPCDTCIFMADSCHEDMCLHPWRRDGGDRGKALENALLWNGDCPVTIQGEPCFYDLLDSASDFATRRAHAERVRQELAARFAETGTVTADDLRAIEINLCDVEAWSNKGVALYHLKRYPKARQAFEQTAERGLAQSRQVLEVLQRECLEEP